ncbi:unnamed protein product [Lepeophtheirus salmonis]|uniref:(salmon louse) hypothetical protein n=1 Tax=Lepeophtheirus salmonis TaxID=72036 RepID=A0A7R8CTC8_LEPSM|nr:unnamed protein product [Lepeophtheirus salmonis]CAF2872553.1 unnamed protein product [Lepeophtheirus salmonis]
MSAKLINMDHVNSVVIKTVKYIRSRGLNHREFQEFLRHLESQDVTYFTEVHWLSRASTLQRFWLLLDEIILFLKLKQKELNVKLQGQNKLVHDLFKQLRTLERDLQLYEKSAYGKRVAVLREDFSPRFTEIRNLRSEMTVSSLPFTCEISSAAVQHQLELNALQEDDTLIQNFKEMNLIEFYKSLPAADYCNLKRFARRFV